MNLLKNDKNKLEKSNLTDDENDLENRKLKKINEN